MPRYHVEHRTAFEYSAPARECVMELRMQPSEDARQTCERFELSIRPDAATSEYQDPYGNRVRCFTLPRSHDVLEITAEATVHLASSRVQSSTDSSWGQFAAVRHSREYYAWLAPSHFARTSPELESFAAEVGPEAGRSPTNWLATLSERLRAAIRYAPKTTQVDSPIEHCLAQRAGVCQDFAHVFIALARRNGVPCRYVSGYLFHRASSAGVSAEDATHAWAEAFVPGTGWLGFDPTNGIAVGDQHIRVAVGRDYFDVPPTRGVYRGPPASRHDVKVRVERIGPWPTATEEKTTVDQFQCQVQAFADGFVAQLAGSLGASDVAALERSLETAIAAKPRRIVLDMSGMAMLGSAAIGTLVKVRRAVESGGGQLVLASVPESIRRIFVVSKLDSVFRMTPSVDDAAKAP